MPTSVAVRDVTGRRPRFYRPPGGNFNTAVVEAAAALGMSGAYWTVDGVKTEQKVGATPEQLTKFVSDRVRPGAIVLLHNAPTVTIAAVPLLVRALRAKGYTLVTMTELVSARRVRAVRRRPRLPERPLRQRLSAQNNRAAPL
jgi:peptidoglycan/xylan/chitin deacetylase (PgdA/CDA1 family)